MKSLKKYIFEGIVIFSSVLLSLYLGNLNIQRSNFEKKNQYISDLIEVLKEDIGQIESLLEILYRSETYINDLQNDIDLNHKILNDKEVIDKLIDIEVGFSFFPKEGVFNQMISTGTFELIKSKKLKTNLLEIYNHQKARNYATSLEIDNFNLNFRSTPYQRFKIRFDYNLLEGKFYGNRTLTSYIFNKPYYLSNQFYGLLSQAKLYSNMYKRQLSDILNSYKEVLILSEIEIKN